MLYIVLDLEWNQCPYGKEKENKNLPFEIIEIGAVRLDENLQTEDTFEAVIRPKVYKELHYMSKEVTKMTRKDLNKGRSFPNVMNDFLKWCGKEYIFCTWGNVDLIELQRNMEFFHVQPLPTPVYYLDIQKLFSIQYEDGKTRRSLQWAVEFLKLPTDVPYHRADADAHYTAEVMKQLNFEVMKQWVSVDYYRPPKSRKDEIHLFFDNYYKYVSRIFDTRERARKDTEVSSTKCYRCNRPTRKVLRWNSENNKIYTSLSYCEQHGFMKGKIRMKHDRNGYFVVKTLKLITPEKAQEFKDKEEEKEKKRKEMLKAKRSPKTSGRSKKSPLGK